jgi:hypothetical protein
MIIIIKVLIMTNTVIVTGNTVTIKDDNDDGYDNHDSNHTD